MADMEITGFLYAKMLVVEADGNFRVTMCVPEPGISEREFNAGVLRRASESAAARLRGFVNCVRAEEGSRFLSPHKVTKADVPPELIASLDEPTNGQYLYRRAVGSNG